MLSWLTWPVDWLARKISEPRVRKLQAALGDERYIDTDRWAKLNRINKQQAKAELDAAVKAGILANMYLYLGDDAPGDFLVPKEFLDQPIRLVDLGFIDEDEDRTITARSLSSKQVYVAAEGQAESEAETVQLAHAT
jgi:hypothetical protein